MKTKSDYKIEHKGPIAATDIIIEYSNGRKDGIILIMRKYSPYGIALPGGFAEYGLSYEGNAVKEAKEETGLNVELENPEHPLCVYSDPKRDPRGHITSLTYTAKGYGVLKSGDDAKSAALYSIDELIIALEKETFAFNDHKRALHEYLKFRGYEKWKNMI